MADLTPKIDDETLATMKARLREGSRWAAYQNAALDSVGLGEIRFLHVGAGCTLATAPPRYPDTKQSTGWRHIFIGWVDFETGEIVKGDP